MNSRPIKIFQESQAQALLTGAISINEQMIQRAVDILAIKVSKTFAGGTHISDFSFEDGFLGNRPRKVLRWSRHLASMPTSGAGG